MDLPVKNSWVAMSLLLGALFLISEPGRAQTSAATFRKTTTVVVNNDPATVRMVDNWIDTGSVAPNSIQSKRENPGDTMLKPVTVILASELELGNQVYETKGRHSAPRNVVLVADTIRITGPVTFDLSGYDVDASSKKGLSLLDRSGGDLVILARNFVCEANGKLIFRSSGGDAESPGTSERCSTKSAGLCKRSRATCGVVHGTDGSSSEVCRWDSIGSASACSGTAGIWTPVGSRYAKNHPDAVPRGKAGACITEVTNIVSNHKNSPRRAAPGGIGGNLVIAAERFSFGAGLHESEAFRDLGCIEASAEGGAGGGNAKPGTVRLYDSMKQAAAELQQEGRRSYGVPVASYSADYAISKWVTALLDDAITGVRVAGLTTGKIEAARRLRQATSLSDWNKYPVQPEDRPAFEEHLIDLGELQEKYQTALWTSSRSLSTPSGVPLQVDLYTEGRELRTRVAPTVGLVRSRVLDGRTVIGLLEFNPEQPDMVRMEFEVELAVDPWLESLLAAELTAEGDEYAGIFSNWILTGQEISELGIRGSSVKASAESAQVSLTVDAGLGQSGDGEAREQWRIAPHLRLAVPKRPQPEGCVARSRAVAATANRPRGRARRRRTGNQPQRRRRDDRIPADRRRFPSLEHGSSPR